MIPQHEQPTTAELHERYGVSQTTELFVAEQRLLLVEGIAQPEQTFIAVDGPCPLTINPAATEREAQAKIDNAEGLVGYIALDRECFFKPRSTQDAWHGLDETDRAAAYEIVTGLAGRHGNVIAEVGSLEQVRRYGHALVAMWTGGRNVLNDRLFEDLALYDPTLPLFVKNGLDGDIAPALDQIKRVRQLRGEEGAPAVLVYRGGTNAQTPRASQEQYKRAHEATGGILFYDTAHGVEMAYHPQEGYFEKSIEGQIRASEALIEMSEDEDKYAPLGKFSEASDIVAIMDPHMPLRLALEHNRVLYAAKIGQMAAERVAA